LLWLPNDTEKQEGSLKETKNSQWIINSL
jgi:hypothetical protein